MPPIPKAFGYMWAGARGSHGATQGRVCYEVRVCSNQPTGHLWGVGAPHVLRCGWSLAGTDLQLGETKLSFGYGGTGKKSENNKYTAYGCKFGVGDVVGCYLDFSSEPTSAIMMYTVNGVLQPVAFKVPKSQLAGRPLFPHVLTKNQNYAVNFGQLQQPLFPILPDFCLMNQAAVRVRGPAAPSSPAECEVLMMIGLPGAGKTYWAEQRRREQPEKNYTILGTNNLIDKMKVDGLRRQGNYSQRWDELIKQCSECFEKLLSLAPKCCRNYIIDQTNVFPTARGRKLQKFSGFQLVAVVVVPGEYECRRRLAKVAPGKEVPDQAVLNMKANFTLPDVEESFFISVLYNELSPDQTRDIVHSYNAEAESRGVAASGGVMSFRARNEKKRAEQELALPGKLEIKSEQCVEVKTEEMTNDPISFPPHPAQISPGVQGLPQQGRWRGDFRGNPMVKQNQYGLGSAYNGGGGGAWSSSDIWGGNFGYGYGGLRPDLPPGGQVGSSWSWVGNRGSFNRSVGGFGGCKMRGWRGGRRGWRGRGGSGCPY